MEMENQHFFSLMKCSDAGNIEYDILNANHKTKWNLIPNLNRLSHWAEMYLWLTYLKMCKLNVNPNQCWVNWDKIIIVNAMSIQCFVYFTQKKKNMWNQHHNLQVLYKIIIMKWINFSRIFFFISKFTIIWIFLPLKWLLHEINKL